MSLTPEELTDLHALYHSMASDSISLGEFQDYADLRDRAIAAGQEWCDCEDEA